jgi:concanavalin A-like lectin/glucanase superfamily protein
MKARYLQIGVIVVFVASLLAVSSYAEVDLGNCVGMWLFNDDEDDIAIDSSGNENDGLFVGDPEWVDGKFGSALEFEGAGSHVNIVNSESLNSDSFTLSLWAQPNQLRIQGLADKTPAPNWRLFMNSPAGSVEFDALPGEIANIATPVMSVGEWSHIAATYDADTETAKIYFNGVFIREAKGVDMNTNSASNIHIASPENNRFAGIIDDVGIFNVALDIDDINEIMTEGLEGATGMTAVEASGKLAATWASIKTQ